MFGNYFRFLVFKEKRKKKFQNEKHVWLVEKKKKKFFQKQNLGNLFGICFWKSWILFCLANLKHFFLFILIQKYVCFKVFKINILWGIIKSNALYITFMLETLIIQDWNYINESFIQL